MDASAAHKAKEEAAGATRGSDDQAPVAMVPHSTFSASDVDLRAAADEAEAERLLAAKEGYVAAPGVGDYHATRRNLKQVTAAAEGLGLEPDDLTEAVVAQARKGVTEVRKAGKAAAAAARRVAARDGDQDPGAVHSRSTTQEQQTRTGEPAKASAEPAKPTGKAADRK
jgi:hypothetical protein